jgi:hypothetical protein
MSLAEKSFTEEMQFSLISDSGLHSEASSVHKEH